MTAARLVGTLAMLGSAGVIVAAAWRATGPPAAPPAAADRARSSAWLSRLPDGEVKRKFILDCTGCHQFDEQIARPQGTPRTEAQWTEAVTRMLGYAGAATSFPVIAADRDAKATAAWLAKSLAPGDVADITVTASGNADVREYLMPVAQDLPHDLRRLAGVRGVAGDPGEGRAGGGTVSAAPRSRGRGRAHASSRAQRGTLSPGIDTRGEGPSLRSG